MKVRGESSDRWFDPDDAGGSIVKKSWANPSFNQSGIDDISTHLSRFDDGAEISANCFGPKIDRTRLQFKNCNFEYGKTQIHHSR